MLINQLPSTQPNASAYTQELSNQSSAKTTALTQQNKKNSPTQNANPFTNSQKARVATSEIISANHSMGFLQSASQSLQKLQDTIQVNSYNGKEIFSGGYEEINNTLVQTLKTKHQNQPLFNTKPTNSPLQKMLALPSLSTDSSLRVKALEDQTQLLQEELQDSIKEAQDGVTSSVEQLQTEQAVRLNEQEKNIPLSYPSNNTYLENFSSIARQAELSWLLR
mgnify:FL=1